MKTQTKLFTALLALALGVPAMPSIAAPGGTRLRGGGIAPLKPPAGADDGSTMGRSDDRIPGPDAVALHPASTSEITHCLQISAHRSSVSYNTVR